MAVNFPIPDYPEIETLTEMVSRVLIPYSSALGLDIPVGPRQVTRSASLERVERPSHYNTSEDSQSH